MYIKKPINVNTLFLTWHPRGDSSRRYNVATLIRKEDDNVEFLYNKGSTDFEDAINAGFTGYTAFPIHDQDVYDHTVMSMFMNRTPPRSRGDFKKYLMSHQVDPEFNGDGFQMICHTGVGLPNDDFNVIPDLSQAERPFEYRLEVAGTRHVIRSGEGITREELREIELETEATFEFEPNNVADSNAIAILVNNKKVGYVNRILCSAIKQFIDEDRITAKIVRVSGTEERPIIYILIFVN
ncbi:MAG: HIRAN domain-containing protein [Vibrio sp.]